MHSLVGNLDQFSIDRVRDHELVDSLRKYCCFGKHQYEERCLTFLREHYPTIKRHVAAYCEQGDWTTLLNVPDPGPLVEFWKEKNLLREMYFCLVTIVLWRNLQEIQYYQYHFQNNQDYQFLTINNQHYQFLNINNQIMLLDKRSFKVKYEEYEGMNPDNINSWETLCQFRNVLRLVLQINADRRSKGVLIRVAAILAEGRIYSTGGGQSLQTNRRLCIYDVEVGQLRAVP